MANSLPSNTRVSKPAPGALLPRLFLWTVAAAGTASLVAAVVEARSSASDVRWILLSGLTIAGAIATLRMKTAPVSFSISDAFTLTTALLVGPDQAIVTAALEALAISLLLSRRKLQPTRMVFNVAAVSLAMRCAGLVIVEIAPGGAPNHHVAVLLAAVACGAGVYFAVNTVLIALAVSAEQGRGCCDVWREHFVSLWPSYFGGAYTALLLSVFAPTLDLARSMLLLPMPLVLYLAFRMWLGRVQDRLAFLDTSNRQYRATIDALAQAIDAKDQVTSGHIQRVQTYCLEVARSLGWNGEAELRALEAASLLHDLGKLAISEHILNKPGRLTPAEFERMKQHAAIGADILSSIEFPYPVVPIVRHHHEAWDGSGYPDGLAGEAIPFGARILSVADCFDALTSDRPYRPRMTVPEAVAILRDRRGTMYDPHIVDALLELLPRIVQPEPAAVSPAARAVHGAHMVKRLTVAAEEEGAFAAFGPLLADLCQRLGADAAVLLVHDAGADLLRAVAACGESAGDLHRLRFALGSGVSGWVAATQTAQRNADARLDLAALADRAAAPLTSVLSVPAVRDGALAGVLTVYSSRTAAFSEGHQLALEVAAATLLRVGGSRNATSAGRTAVA